VVTPVVTIFDCFLFHRVLQDIMQTDQHPLITHLQTTGESLSAFARRAKTSRMQLYRIMAGAATTTSRLEKISAATAGELSVADLLPRKQREAAQ